MNNVMAKGGVEFVAVFLGIILSLWVDDYTDILNDRKKEKEALGSIVSALRSDIENIDWTIKRAKRAQSRLKSLLTEYDSLSLDTLEYYVDMANGYVTFSLQETPYETLKNTGQLYKISDQDLLRKIIVLYNTHYNNVKTYLEEDKRNIFLIEDHFIDKYEIAGSKYWWITLKDREKGLKELKNDTKYFNYLVVSYNIKTYMIMAFENLNKVAESTLKDIETTLEES